MESKTLADRLDRFWESITLIQVDMPTTVFTKYKKLEWTLSTPKTHAHTYTKNFEVKLERIAQLH